VEEVIAVWTTWFARQGSLRGISDAPAWWVAQAIPLRSFEAGHGLSGCNSSTAD